MSKELIALLGGKETGRFVRDNRGKLTFTHNEQWREVVSAYPLSFVLDAPYSGRQVRAREGCVGHDEDVKPL